jgi:hypothetical protein
MKRKTEITMILLAVVLLSAMVVGELNTIDGNGTIAVSVKCAHNFFSKEVIIAPIGNFPASTFRNETSVAVTLNPNGKYESRFPPGNYSVYLRDGNGGMPELQFTSVYAGYQSMVSFIGHAISSRHYNDTPAPVPEPTTNPECNHRPDRPGCPGYIPTPSPTPTPTPTPEYACYDYCVLLHVFHPAVTHTECVYPDGNNDIQCMCEERTIIDVPEWMETIVTHRTKCGNFNPPIFGFCYEDG